MECGCPGYSKSISGASASSRCRLTARRCRTLYDRTKMPDSSAERRTDEPAHPATDTRHRGHAGAGDPRGTAFRPEPHQRNQRRPGQSVGDGQRYCERSGRENSGHRPASLWPGPRPRPRHARQGGLFGVPVGRARGIPAVHRDTDHQSRRQPVLQLAADQPDPRSQGSRIFQAGPGCERRRHAGAGVRPADRDIGAADRLSGARGIRRAEIHPARLVQPAQIRRVITTSGCSSDKEILLVDSKGMVLVAPHGKGLDRARRRIDREIRTCSGLPPRRTASASAR